MFSKYESAYRYMYEDQLETERIGYLSGIGADYIPVSYTHLTLPTIA